MEFDDKTRAGLGVVISLRDMGNGASRFFFDDVKPDRLENPINWAHDHFFTFTPEFKNSSLDQMQIEDRDFQKIGEAVVARLLALNNRVK